MFYKSKVGSANRYIFKKSNKEVVVVDLDVPFNIYIQNEEGVCWMAHQINLHPEHYEKITHAQFYSVYFDAIEHLKEFLPDKNKDIFEPHGIPISYKIMIGEMNKMKKIENSGRIEGVLSKD